MEFSKHSLEQIKERNIDINDVKNIINNPVEIIREDNLSVYHGIININDRTYLLRIFVNLESNPAKIVTVYKTSKIDKYLNL